MSELKTVNLVFSLLFSFIFILFYFLFLIFFIKTKLKDYSVISYIKGPETNNII